MSDEKSSSLMPSADAELALLVTKNERLMTEVADLRAAIVRKANRGTPAAVCKACEGQCPIWRGIHADDERCQLREGHIAPCSFESLGASPTWDPIGGRPINPDVVASAAMSADSSSAAMPAHYVEHPNKAEALPRNRKALADIGRNPDGSPKAKGGTDRDLPFTRPAQGEKP